MIEGSLRDAPLSDVFQIIVSGQKSGILTVVRGSARARIYFEFGRVQYAHLTPGIHLGEMLVRMDLLDTHEVQEILLKQTMENAGTPLGLMAVDQGLIENGELGSALKAQTLEVMTELMLWKSGSFSFEDRSLLASQVPTEHTLDAMMLLMEVAKRLDEWANRVDPGSLFERVGDPTKVTMPQGGWEVLGYVDGKRSAASIAAELDLPERAVYRILYELQQSGIIRPLPFQLEEPLVLVVSQSSALQRLMCLALQRARLRTDIAHDTAEAMTYVHAQHPRAIVLDDESENGWSFVRELRRLPAQGHLPILMLQTSEPSGGFFSRLRRPKALALKKPFHELEFQQVVTQMVGRSLT